MTATTSKWTEAQVEAHLKANLNHEGCYGAAIVCAALFHKIYGHFPKVGLSGYQGEAAKKLVEAMPDPSGQLKFDFDRVSP